MYTSNGSAVSYIAWCDNQISFTNNDCIICKDRVTIDMSASVRGVIPLGNPITPTAILVCRSTDLSEDGISNLVWENTPAASYELTVDGVIYIGSYAGFQIGSSSNPIPASTPAKLTFVPSTTGTNNTYSGIQAPFYSTSARPMGKSSLIFYGEVPTNRTTNLAQTANINQTHLITTDDMSGLWNVGDRLVIGKQVVQSSGAHVPNIIGSFNSTDITLTSNILTYQRYVGATVVNLSRQYGIEIKASTNVPYYFQLAQNLIHFKVSGCYLFNVSISTLYYNTTANYSSSYSSKYVINDNTYESQTTTSVYLCSISTIPKLGAEIKNNICHRGLLIYMWGAQYSTVFKSGVLTIENNYTLNPYAAVSGSPGTTNPKLIINNNTYDNPYPTYPGFMLNGKNPIVTNNKFWGAAVSTAYGGAISFGISCLNAKLSGNTFDNCYAAYGFADLAVFINALSKNDNFGQEYPNTFGVFTKQGIYGEFLIQNPIGNVTVETTLLPETTNGTKIGIVANDSVPRVDSKFLTEGYYVRCGDGLADTTTHTVGDGKYSLRMEAAQEPLQFTQEVPTGDIQNKTMSVLVWCKINSSNYYSSEFSMPKLIVSYDDGTISSSSASQTTDWQLLFVPISPTTTTGRINVTLQTETDVVGPDAYVYFDDMSILYPAGHQLNLGGMDIWSGGEPITPSIATNINAADVWAYPTAILTASGTTGKKLVDDLTVNKFMALQ
jgi:hypothetical protein